MDNKNNRKKLYEYNNVLKSIDDCYRNIAKRYGVSEAAFWTLYTLRMEPGNITQSDVCTVLYQPMLLCLPMLWLTLAPLLPFPLPAALAASVPLQGLLYVLLRRMKGK